MKTCIIFGGSGYIGTHLALHLLKRGTFDHVHLADIRASSLEQIPGISTSYTDVRHPIVPETCPHTPEWVFNLAAIHREPGHSREEFYETNLKGAKNVCDYASAVGCSNIFFTSSISVYGPITAPTSESSPIQPSTPYGGSKYNAELIHEIWRHRADHRRLIISRPGVLYGPGDPGNIFRMIRAIQRGFLPYPGSLNIYKSYAYIFGFLDSIDFSMNSSHEQLCYNYVEYPTEPLKELVRSTKEQFRPKAIVVPFPVWMLLPIASVIQALFGATHPIHPVRVRKAAAATHIIPKTLLREGYKFKYDFAQSLRHWAKVSPNDFTSPSSGIDPEKVELNLSHSAYQTQDATHPDHEKQLA